MFRIVISVILYVCCTNLFLAQGINSDSLNQKINNNKELFKTEPYKAFKEIDLLLAEAIKLKDADAELKILSTRYEYDFLLEIDFEQMINSANILKDRAIFHKDIVFEAKAHKYLSQTYSFNELYDKAISELQLGMKILSSTESNDSDIIMERANFHTAFANIYTLKNEHFSGVQSLLNSVKEHEKLSNPELKRGTKFMDYANLGGAYLKINLDSAKYYANKSIGLSTSREKNHNLMFINYLTIGNVHLEKKEYDKALQFYKKAENIKENKYFLNIKELYEKLITVYNEIDDVTLKKEYATKLKDLSLTVTESQNKSLRNIIRNDKTIGREEVVPNNNLWIWITLACLSLLIFIILNFYSKKIKSEKNKSTILTPETYNNLLSCLKDNDQTFLLAFETEFPIFIEALANVCPELSNAEVELLAMVKLGLSNKEIAKYKFIQHKTVQNKRHIIRKKLNLPNSKDLNKWIDNLG